MQGGIPEHGGARVEHDEQGACLDEPAPVGLDGPFDPHCSRPRRFGHGHHPIRPAGQQDGLPVAGVEPAGHDRPAESSPRSPGTDVIEHGGGQTAVQPASPAPVLGKRLEPGLGLPGSGVPGGHGDLRMQGTEQPGRFGGRRVVAGAGFGRGQTGLLREPANNVAK